MPPVRTCSSCNAQLPVEAPTGAEVCTACLLKLGLSSKSIIGSEVATARRLFRPAFGAVLAVLCGLGLWSTPLGEAWVNASYDYLFLFSVHTVTNKVVIVAMDNEARAELKQPTHEPWDRALHAKLLDKMAADACRLVVFDTFFRSARNPDADKQLAESLRRQHWALLMAEQASSTIQHQESSVLDLQSAGPNLPDRQFLDAANTNWGVGWLDWDRDLVVRRHWPFPAPGSFPSLPEAATRLAGGPLDSAPKEAWVRYYGQNGACAILSYNFALTVATNYFRDKIVFIGSRPRTPVPDPEHDSFGTPFTKWTGEAAGGVEILATEFLNLMNEDWLRRPVWWLEMLLLVAAGLLIGGGLPQVKPLTACGLALCAGLLLTFGGVSLSHCSNFWFPWLVVVGGQLPCGLVWALVPTGSRRETETPVKTGPISSAALVDAPTVVGVQQDLPDTPDYELFDPPFGQGGFGKVWLARNAIGEWQALKAVYQAKFGRNARPYETEFKGIKKYKPISGRHPGLLRVDFVSRKKREGYFYYVMELGDSQTPGWQQNPTNYKPRDLASVRAQAEGRRLPVGECVRIGVTLAETLDFLHKQGIAHRDIKPQNIIFVNGLAKFADVGLVAEIRSPEEVTTWAGTCGYMPPPPEPPGTIQADIYALGMVLYVIFTGHDPTSFPELSTTLFEQVSQTEPSRLNEIILKACQPDRARRYPSATELHGALLEAQLALKQSASGP